MMNMLNLETIPLEKIKKEEGVDEFSKQSRLWSPFTSANLNMFFTVHYFDKSKHIEEKVMYIENIKQNFNEIYKSKLVVFDIRGKNKKVLLDLLSDMGNLCNHYGLVVEVAECELYYFPRLNYGDAYLIKDLFQKQFSNRKIRIYLGKNAI